MAGEKVLAALKIYSDTCQALEYKKQVKQEVKQAADVCSNNAELRDIFFKLFSTSRLLSSKIPSPFTGGVEVVMKKVEQ